MGIEVLKGNRPGTEPTRAIRYRKGTKRSIYTACEGLNFHWGREEVQEFRDMWEMGIPIDYIASHFGRKVDEVALLVMDQSRLSKIKHRPGGVFGRDWPWNG